MGQGGEHRGDEVVVCAIEHGGEGAEEVESGAQAGGGDERGGVGGFGEEFGVGYHGGCVSGRGD